MGQFSPRNGTFAGGIQYSLDLIRGIPDIMGMRPYTCAVLVRTWSGARVGLGTKTDVTTPILLANGQHPKVRRLSQKDIIPSNTLFIEGDYKIGPMTQEYTDPLNHLAGIGASVFDPAVAPAVGTEIYIQVLGPDAKSSQYCSRIYYDATHPLSRIAVVRPTGFVV